MEAYRNKLKKQSLFGFLVGGLLIILAIAIFLTVDENTEGPLAHALGFVTGAATGIGFVMFFVAIKNRIALKDEDKLKAHYIKNNDERLAAAIKNAYTVGACIAIIGLLIAAIIAQFFNQVVAATLVATIFFITAVLLICKVIYLKKS